MSNPAPRLTKVSRSSSSLETSLPSDPQIRCECVYVSTRECVCVWVYVCVCECVRVCCVSACVYVWMRVCVCVCVCVRVCVCVCECAWVWVYCVCKCVCVSVCMCVNVCMCVSVCMCVIMCECVWVSVCVNVWVRVRACVRAFAHSFVREKEKERERGREETNLNFPRRGNRSLLLSTASPHSFCQVVADVSEQAVVSTAIVAVTVHQIHLYGAQNVKDIELGWKRSRSVYEDMREFCYTKSGRGRKSDSRMAIVLS